MKHLFTLLFAMILGTSTLIGQVAVNQTGASADNSAILDVQSDTLGMLIPRLTKTQRNAIATPATGLMIFQTDDTVGFYYYTGSQWATIGAEAVSINDLSDGRTGGQSVFLGEGAGEDDDLTINNNVFVGYHAGSYNTTGNGNCAVGSYALSVNHTGGANIAIGHNALLLCVSSGNVGVGFRALAHDSTGLYNVAVGYDALFSNITGSDNVALGYESLLDDTSGSSNVAIGASALHSNKDISNLVAIGDSALYYNSVGATGYYEAKGNTAVGAKSLFHNTTGYYNTALGFKSQFNNTTGSTNDSYGYQALYSNTSGYNNVAIGSNALFFNIDGGANVAVGPMALDSNVTGNDNIALGYQAMLSNKGGDANIAFGLYSLYNNTSGSNNVGIGKSVLHSNSTGKHNVAVGEGAGYYNQEGSNNTIIGYEAGHGASYQDISGNVFLGYRAGFIESGNNKLYIENSSSADPLIYGEFDNDIVSFNGKVGIWTKAPNELLEVASPTNGKGRMIVSDGMGANRNALLFMSPEASDHRARIEAYDYQYDNGDTLLFNTYGDGICIFGGDVLPETHKGENFGASGQAWNNVYAHNYITEGSAAFSGLEVTKQLLDHPPMEKPAGAFDEFTEKGLKELDPASLPETLTENNALLIDEIATYNYKANYEQQVQIEQLIKLTKQLIAENEKLSTKIKKLEQNELFNNNH